MTDVANEIKDGEDMMAGDDGRKAAANMTTLIRLCQLVIALIILYILISFFG